MKHSLFGKGAVLCVILSCFFLLCACAHNTDPLPEGVLPDKPDQPFNIFVEGHDIGEYSIVYAPAPYSKNQCGQMETDYDFYRLTAERIADCIKARTGKTLPVVSDRDVRSGNPYEILVGPTNRTQSKKKIDSIFKYEIEVVGTYITVIGGTNASDYLSGVRSTSCFASVYQAWDQMEALCEQHKHDIVELKNGDLLKGEAEIYVIACIGDSITDGFGSNFFGSNGSPFSYPAVLGRILWKDCLVLNYGCCGATMRHDLGLPYTSTAHYGAMAKNAEIFDLAFVMLGTNDSYNDYLWTQDSNRTYLKDGTDLAATMRQDNPSLPIVLMNNPAYYGTADFGMGHVRALQNELYTMLSEQEAPVMFFDMNAFTAKEVTSAHFPDALHPDDYGYLQMAHGVSQVVQAIREGAYTFELPAVEDDRFPHGADLPEAHINPEAENLLGIDAIRIAAIGSCECGTYYFDGAPYYITDQTAVEGHTVTDLQLPISYCREGDLFTVTVYRAGTNEIVGQRKLTAPVTAGGGWIAFSELDLAVPQGCFLAFGAPGDSMNVLWMNANQPKYRFTCMTTGESLQSCLPCNIYGIPLN